MKKSTIILGILIIVAAFTLSSCGVGHMFGRSGMMGYRGYDQPERYVDQQNSDYYASPTDELSIKMEELDYKYHERFQYLEGRIRSKENEITLLLNSNDPDIDEIRSINREINELKLKFEEEELNYESDARKIISKYE